MKPRNLKPLTKSELDTFKRSLPPEKRRRLFACEKPSRSVNRAKLRMAEAGLPVRRAGRRR